MKQLEFTAVHAIFKILSTSLGPKGLDKVIVNIQKSKTFEKNESQQLDTDDLIITNDGATIMKSLPISHPLGIILQQLSNSIDTKIGDGTTSGVILACKLLKESEKLLIRNYHPNLIIKAFTIAYEQSKLLLNSNSIELSITNDLLSNNFNINNNNNNNNSGREYETIKILEQIISTSLSSKILNSYVKQFTRYCFEAISIIKEIVKHSDDDDDNDDDNGFDGDKIRVFDNIQSNIKYIKLLGNNISSSKLIRGIILPLNLNYSNLISINKNDNNEISSSPSQVLTFNVVLINFDIGYIDENSFKLIQYSNLNFNKREMIENEKRQLEIKQAKEFIDNLKKQNATCNNNNNNNIIIFSSKRISLSCLKLLQDNNIKTIFNLDNDQLFNIQQVTNSSVILNSITSNITKNSSSIFGNCNLNILFEKQSEYYIEIKNDNCKICTFLLKAPSIFIIEEVQRSLNDSISILSLIFESKKVIAGGGSNEIMLSVELEKFIKSDKFKELMKNEKPQDIIKYMNSIKAFSKSLEIIPKLLISNAGFDSIILFQHLKSIHKNNINNNNNNISINLDNGKLCNMIDLGVIESLKGKEIMLKMIIDTVSMIIKIDQLIKN
ncbi:hypothetical protein ACTFIR_006999 [Dictyostelium discoideum]